MIAPRLAPLWVLVAALTACGPASVEGPFTWGSADGVMKYGSLYFAGQPDAAGLAAARDAGVGVVIDLRHPSEEPWDEVGAAEQLGLAYYNVPVDGRALSRDAMHRIDEIVDRHRGEELLIHCKSGNRAGAWLAIHLAERRGMEPGKALAIGRRAGITKDELAANVTGYLEASGS